MSDNILDEFKHVSEDRRFIMTRYMQAGVIYITTLGFGVKFLLQADTKIVLLTFAIFFESINISAILLARKFRDLAMHSINRETELAKKLNFQPPYSLMWGYWGGLMTACFSILAFLILTIVRFRFLR